ncbi:acyl-CoA thioesterase [Glutamicibacter sp. MCAF14]|jgi:acyl-CoA thioester hydrolase|uniref:acyl-CoA thioesterase n=1 Tax=Glutamicibacter sp. MCAF14 TaxID=3233043 RepID=UPI003F900157
MTSQVSQPTQRAEKLTFPVPIRWSDQDANGHVNNARILTLVEEGRIQAGYRWWGANPDESSPRVVRAMSVDYRNAVHYGPETTIDVWISRIGTTSYTVSQELFQQGRSCVSAEVVIVILDRDTRQPMTLPESVRETLHANLFSDQTPQN